MAGVCARLPLTRDYIDSFPLRVFEITSAKPRTALGNSVFGTQGCEPAKDAPPYSSHEVSAAPVRKLAESVLAKSSWEPPLRELQWELQVSQSTL